MVKLDRAARRVCVGGVAGRRVRSSHTLQLRDDTGGRPRSFSSAIRFEARFGIDVRSPIRFHADTSKKTTRSECKPLTISLGKKRRVGLVLWGGRPARPIPIA